MKSLLSATGIVSAAIALAPQASASNQDDNFLALLAQAGIPAHDGIPGVISTGHNVCVQHSIVENHHRLSQTLSRTTRMQNPLLNGGCRGGVSHG